MKQAVIMSLMGIAVAGAAAAGFYIGRESDSVAEGDTPSLPPAQIAATASQPETKRAAVDATPHDQTLAHAKFTHFRVGQRNVKRILADDDVVWVGTSGGVVRYELSTDKYRLYDNKTGLLANGVFHLSKLKDRLLVGTYGGGMSILQDDGESWTTYNISEGLADAFVYDVLEDGDGDVWIATWSGANRVRGGTLDQRDKWDTFTVENTGGGLPNDWVYALASGADGEIWMATEGGLARYSEGEWQNWKHADGLGAPYEQVKAQITFTNDPAKMSEHHARQKTEMGLEGVEVAYNPNYIVALLVDRDGVVWCGTWGGGLARFDGKNWTNYTMADGLPANHIFMLHEDEDGSIWVGTSAGLARRDDQGFKVYTMREGLFSNAVFSMETDRDGRIWVGSYGGVARIDTLN